MHVHVHVHVHVNACMIVCVHILYVYHIEIGKTVTNIGPPRMFIIMLENKINLATRKMSTRTSDDEILNNISGVMISLVSLSS